MKKIKPLTSFLLVMSALLMFAGLSAAIWPVMAKGETLTIHGDGVEREITYSREELEELSDIIENRAYSVSNNFPTNKTEYNAGIPLTYLLKQAGIKESAQKISFVASDGYRREFTLSELISESRYCFTENGGKTSVPVMVCLTSSERGLDSLEPIDLKLVMGQRAPSEQTNPWFVKYLTAIEVSCEKPEMWPAVTFNRVAGQDGVTLQLLHESIDLVKIYYTTDGSIPTVNSSMYNISASYYQPQLNKPLLINETKIVRAVAIGPGKENSVVSSISVFFDKTGFSDLDGYEWAKPAIEELNKKGIINGIDSSRFDPSGNLTRAMFATMLGRALNKNADSPASVSNGLFSDVDSSSWFAPHVQWAADKGIVQGYPDGTFKPNNLLSVEEMIIMAVRAGELDTDNLPEVRLKGISDWARIYALAAEKNNMLIRGVLAKETANDITVDGQRKAVRAEATVLVYELLKALG